MNGAEQGGHEQKACSIKLAAGLWKTLEFSHIGSHVSAGLWPPSCSWAVAG